MKDYLQLAVEEVVAQAPPLRYCQKLILWRAIHRPEASRAASSTKAHEETWLYRYWDKAGRLLYVGITNDLARRDFEHSKFSEWYVLVHERTDVSFISRALAAAEEIKVIQTEQPVWNKIHALELENDPRLSSVESGFV